MKKLLFIAIFFTSCASKETSKEKYDRWMSELECPVILIGKTDKSINYPSIIVRDGAKRIRTLGGVGSNVAMSSSIADSREIGDTLKPCNPSTP